MTMQEHNGCILWHIENLPHGCFQRGTVAHGDIQIHTPGNEYFLKRLSYFQFNLNGGRKKESYIHS